MSYSSDKRIVMSLDGGGTNFVFSAVQAEKEIIDPITQSAKGENLEAILKNIIEGFNRVKLKINKKPAAISFCFPGPADYENGIIGDLQNLPRLQIRLARRLRHRLTTPLPATSSALSKRRSPPASRGLGVWEAQTPVARNPM